MADQPARIYDVYLAHTSQLEAHNSAFKGYLDKLYGSEEFQEQLKKRRTLMSAREKSGSMPHWTQICILPILRSASQRAGPSAQVCRHALTSHPGIQVLRESDPTEAADPAVGRRECMLCSTVPHVADFEGIRLTGDGPAGGCVLMLRASPAISMVVSLPQGAEVEVRRGVPAVVVRGISAT